MTACPPGPRWLYLHGFASGPQSAKGMAVAGHYARHGIPMERLDLRLPSMENLRLSAMIAQTRAAVGDAADRAVVFGSSLGGLTAARAAERDPRICALVLLAPAFRFAERWRIRLGEEAWSRWEESGWWETPDYATGGVSRVDFEFMRDAMAIDREGQGWPDVRVPTLIVHGRHDATVDPDLSRAWAHGKRHVRLVETDDAHELAESLAVILRESERFLAPFLG